MVNAVTEFVLCSQQESIQKDKTPRPLSTIEVSKTVFGSLTGIKRSRDLEYFKKNKRIAVSAEGIANPSHLDVETASTHKCKRAGNINFELVKSPHSISDEKSKSINLDLLKLEGLTGSEFIQAFDYALSIRSTSFIEKCCSFLTRASGANFQFQNEEKGEVLVHIFEFSDVLMKCLSFISKSQLRISLKLEKEDSLRYINKYLNLYFDKIIVLNLWALGDLVNQQFKEVINSCINLKCIYIKSKKLTFNTIESIREKIYLEELVLNECENLENLPDLSKLIELKKIDLSNCRNLKILPDIQSLSKLEVINLEGCESIAQIPIYTALKFNNSIQNPSLIRKMIDEFNVCLATEFNMDCVLESEHKKYLPGDGQSFLIDFRDEIFENNDVMKCFVLKNFNPSEYPEYYPIEIIDQCENYFQVNLCRKHFQTRYYEILEKLSKVLERNCYNNVDFQVEYFGENGRDFGALRNDFIINLLETVSENWSLQSVMIDEDIAHFRQLGGLLRFVLDSSEKLVVGDIFSFNFFDALLKLNENEKFLDVNLISRERILEISYPFLDANQKALVNGSLSLDNIELIEDAILKPSRGRVKNLQRVLEGFGYNHLEWESLQKKGVNSLYISVVGEFDFTKFLESICFNNIDEGRRKVILEWLKNLTEDKARRFLRFVTSIPKVPLIKKIEVLEKGEKIIFQTCFKKIFIPKQIEKNLLIECLEYTIVEGNNDFFEQ